jgi:hypothetical protein
MKAEERKPEKHLYREEKNMLRWNKYVALYFCGLCEDVSKRRYPLTTSKHLLVQLVIEKILFMER